MSVFVELLSCAVRNFNFDVIDGVCDTEAVDTEFSGVEGVELMIEKRMLLNGVGVGVDLGSVDNEVTDRWEDDGAAEPVELPHAFLVRKTARTETTGIGRPRERAISCWILLRPAVDIGTRVNENV